MQELLRELLAAGAGPLHIGKLLRGWLAGGSLGEGRRMETAPLPARLRAALPAIAERLEAVATVVEEHAGEDGSARLLFRFADGRTAESVLLPREGVCISSQVGCAVACRFCMTGRDGLVRNLTSGEMLAQVVGARRRRAVRRVVFMGMGEPSHNLAAVLETINTLGEEGGLGQKDLVFSTVGDPKVFEKLLQNRVKPALALSLHSTDAALRAHLLPRAPRIEPRELLLAAESYARATTYPFQLQWTLLQGVNDGDAELERLADWMRGLYGIVNFIPYNAVPHDGLEGEGFVRPEMDRMREMCRLLHQRGVLAKLRRSAGQDIDAACGQLRARTNTEAPRSLADSPGGAAIG